MYNLKQIYLYLLGLFENQVSKSGKVFLSKDAVVKGAIKNAKVIKE
jgi:hypothetical protein